MTRILKGEREGGFARLHRLPAKIESVKEPGFGETTTSLRSLRGVVKEGAFAGIYDVTQETQVRYGRAFMNRYVLVRILPDGLETTAVYENGKFVQPQPTRTTKRYQYETAERIRDGFDKADEFYVTDPAIIAQMEPTERALRQLYKVSENDLDPSKADSGTSYGIYGDSR